MADNHDLPDDLNRELAAALTLRVDQGRLVLWHRTSYPAAASILAQGFRDATGFILAGVGQEFSGTFVSNRPLDANEGAKGDALLRIFLSLSERDIAEYEVVEESGAGTYREWMMPAEILNEHGAVEQVA